MSGIDDESPASSTPSTPGKGMTFPVLHLAEAVNELNLTMVSGCLITTSNSQIMADDLTLNN